MVVAVAAPVDESPTAIIDSVAAVTDDDENGLETITLTQSSSDDFAISSYAWSIGGAVVGTDASLTYDFVGDTTVTLLVTDDADQTDTTSTVVTVNEPTEPGAIIASDDFSTRSLMGVQVGQMTHGYAVTDLRNLMAKHCG